MTDSTILSGRNQIQKFLGRSWKTIQVWIAIGAPIVKMDGRWESDTEQLLEWRRSKIASKVDGRGRFGEGGRAALASPAIPGPGPAPVLPRQDPARGPAPGPV